MKNIKKSVFSVVLWGITIYLSALFLSAGLTKLVVPLEYLGQAWKWVAETPPIFVYVLGIAEIAGSVAVLFASGLRLWPRLGVVAAAALALTAGSAVVMHFLRSETHELALPTVTAALAIFVAWGRFRWVPIKAEPPRPGTWVSGFLCLLALLATWFLLSAQILPNVIVALAVFTVVSVAMLLYNRPKETGL
jgi:hypothetical protein